MLKETHKRNTRETIVDAAERLLDHYGYSKMTMTDLADEAGIGVGTTYLYFPGKAEVVLAVLERLAASIRHRLQEIAESPLPPADKIHGMLTARLDILYRSAHDHRHQTDDLKRAIQAAVEKRRAGWIEAETAILAGVLEEGLRAEVFDFVDAVGMAQTLMMASNGMTPKNLSRSDFEHPEDFHCKTKSVIDLLLRGMGSQATVSSLTNLGNVC